MRGEFVIVLGLEFYPHRWKERCKKLRASLNGYDDDDPTMKNDSR